MSVKYSIIIPVNNVVNYLPGTISTIMSQKYIDYELIISDDNSTDGTAEYIDTFRQSFIKVLHTPRRMTTAEHFDWALSYATGEWCIFVGGDDGLQPYFFQLADKLTEIATKKNIRTIASRRAYFFWNGCQCRYGDIAVSYSAEPNIYILDSKKEMYNTCLIKDYFELPQMYTTSLFHRSFISDIRKKQDGRFLTYEISDANMAALSTTYEDRYLQCDIPLGWVGSSPKGLHLNNHFAKLATDSMPKECGDYRIGSLSLYFWGALQTVIKFCPEHKTKCNDVNFIKKMLPYIYLQFTENKTFKDSEKYRYFIDMLKINGLSLNKIIKKVKIIKIKKIIINVMCFPWRCVRYILKRLPVVKNVFLKKEYHVYLKWSDYPDMNYLKAQQMVMKLVEDNIHFGNLNLLK